MAVGRDLAEAISEWLEKKKGTRSLYMLARLASISYSSVRRAAQGEGRITQGIALSIASVVMSESKFKEFAHKHWPHLKRFVVDVAHHPIESEDILDFVKSGQHFKLLVLASSNEGTNEAEVKEKFGEQSIPFFYDLINAGILTRKGDSWQFEKDIGTVSFESTRNCLSNLISICDKRNDYIKGASTSYVGWKSFNIEAAKKANEIATRYCEEMSKLVKNPENSGDVLIFFGVLSNVLKGREKLL